MPLRGCWGQATRLERESEPELEAVVDELESIVVLVSLLALKEIGEVIAGGHVQGRRQGVAASGYRGLIRPWLPPFSRVAVLVSPTADLPRERHFGSEYSTVISWKGRTTKFSRPRLGVADIR